MLLTRNSMLETMREDFVLAARAKGLPDKGRARPARGAQRPAAGGHQPGIQPGVRRGRRRHHRVGLLVARHGADAGRRRRVSEDLPLAVGAFVFVGIFVLLAHLAVDVLYVYLGPKDSLLMAVEATPQPRRAVAAAKCGSALAACAACAKTGRSFVSTRIGRDRVDRDHCLLYVARAGASHSYEHRVGRAQSTTRWWATPSMRPANRRRPAAATCWARTP